MKAMILFLCNRYFYKLFTEIMIPIVKKKKPANYDLREFIS